MAMGFDADEVAQVVQLVDRSEFKRRQAAPVLRGARKRLVWGGDSRSPGGEATDE